MASEYDWQRDGIDFIAEDADGFRLAKEVDGIFNQTIMSPSEYMDRQYPIYPKDQLIPTISTSGDWVPNENNYSLNNTSEGQFQLTRSEKISMAILLGGSAIAAATGAWSVIYVGKHVLDYLCPLLRHLY